MTAARSMDIASCMMICLDQGEICSKNRVAWLASLASIAEQIGYKRRPGRYGGKPAVVADNTLDRQFEVDLPPAKSLTVM